MGAVCYKPKPTTISKEDVLRALNDKHIKESITDPDGYKTYKTDENHTTHQKTFG
jgi:methyl coenzyme M reductase beta subunit